MLLAGRAQQFPARLFSVLWSLLCRACHCARTTIATKRKHQQSIVPDILFFCGSQNGDAPTKGCKSWSFPIGARPSSSAGVIISTYLYLKQFSAYASTEFTRQWWTESGFEEIYRKGPVWVVLNIEDATESRLGIWRSTTRLQNTNSSPEDQQDH